MVKLVELDKKLNLLLDLPSKVNGIEHSIKMLSDKFDEIKRRLDCHEREINNGKRRVEKMEEVRAPQDLSKLQDGMDALEWHSRRLNLEVPETEGENLVNEIAQLLNIECLSEQDLVAIHRQLGREGPAALLCASRVRSCECLAC
ncbi:hypothetical protein HPB49_011690 [Dermacentor silvarum]|uniref:Uncharacterized protein n=1 Tax=Dermacentor silvarum TaxID=543639 RepID=A0ACB8DZR0_DERSI|nr:hypothetical protein HPB49_011690 [Dermacentor silvarum]